jgi:nucleoside-diphosphate-sugar epimerase
VYSVELPREFEALRGKRLFVTGAAGFIGGALFRRLAAYGLDVTGSVLFPEEAEAMRSEGFHIEILDLTSDEPWDHLVENIDIVFHIAATFQEVEKSEDYYDKANNHAVVKLAKAAHKAGVERFVHCSTVGVHGDVKEIPCTERTPFNPMDIYHKTKLGGELALLEFAKTLPDNGMVVTVNRPAMVYGPGDTRMMKLYQSIFKKRFIMIGSGETLAHLGYIDDQVDSLILCAVRPRGDVHMEAFNIASGQPITLNAMAGMIAEEGNICLPRWHVPVWIVWSVALLCEILWKPFGARPPLFRRRVGFFTHNRAFDISKAREKLGYDPKWQEKDGLVEAIKWYKAEGYL